MRDIILIRNRMSKLSRQYDEISQEFGDVVRKATNLRDDYELAKAKALLTADGKNIPERAAQVTVEVSELAAECHAAEGVVEVYKQRLKAISAMLLASQSEASLLKQEMKL